MKYVFLRVSRMFYKSLSIYLNFSITQHVIFKNGSECAIKFWVFQECSTHCFKTSRNFWKDQKCFIDFYWCFTQFLKRHRMSCFLRHTWKFFAFLSKFSNFTEGSRMFYLYSILWKVLKISWCFANFLISRSMFCIAFFRNFCNVPSTCNF